MTSNTKINQFNEIAFSRFRGLLIFEINNIEFCVDSMGIRQILKVTDADLISNNRTISEIILKNARYTLVNIHGLLEFSDVNFGSNSSLILIDIFSKNFGFIVDKIIEIIPVHSLLIDKSLDFIIPGKKNELFSGVLKFGKRKIKMLNLEKITREFDKVIEFPRRMKTYEHIDTDLLKKFAKVMGIKYSQAFVNAHHA